MADRLHNEAREELEQRDAAAFMRKAALEKRDAAAFMRQASVLNATSMSDLQGPSAGPFLKNGMRPPPTTAVAVDEQQQCAADALLRSDDDSDPPFCNDDDSDPPVCNDDDSDGHSNRKNRDSACDDEIRDPIQI